MTVFNCAFAILLAAGPAPATRPDTVAQAQLLAELKTQGRILYEDYQGNRVWDVMSVNPDGSDPQNLTRTGDLHEHWPCASPDGRRIFYVRISSTIERARLLPFRNYAHEPWEWEGHLLATEPTGKNHAMFEFVNDGRRETTTEASGLSASDSGHLAYGDAWSERVFVVDMKTGVRTSHKVTGQPRHLSLAPDGKGLWYAAPGMGWQTYRVDFTTGVCRPMPAPKVKVRWTDTRPGAPRSGEPAPADHVWPAVSHDGKKVVHILGNRPDLTEGSLNRFLVIRDAADGGNFRILLAEPGTDFSCPAWGPGDKYLVYGARVGETPIAFRITRLSDMVTITMSGKGGYRIDPFWILPAPAPKP